MKKLLFRIFALICGVAPVFSQETPGHSIPSSVWQEAGFPYLRNFSPAEYKENPQNWCIARDERGIMYFGNYGVLVYDGVAWKHVKTADTVVRSLCVSGERIYLGAQGNLGFLAPGPAGELRFVSLLDSIPAEHRDFKDVWRTFALDGAVYFQSFKYIFRWKDERFTIWKSEDEFHLSFAANGTFFVRKWDAGLLRLSAGDSLQLVPGGEMFAAERIMVMLPYSPGDGSRRQGDTLLIGTPTNGLFLYDGSRFKPFPSAADALLRENFLYHGAVLPGGLFALGTLRGGVIIIDRDGNLCQVLNKSTGLRDERIHYTFADRAGALWLALDNGLARVELPSPLSRFSAALGIDGTVESLARQGGTLYAATHLGVCYLDEKTAAGKSPQQKSASSGGAIFPQFKAVAGLSSHCWELLAIGKHLLAATDQGVYQISGDRAALLKTGWAGATCFYRSRQDSSRVYVGLFDGLAALQLKDDRWTDLGRFKDIAEQVVSIAEDESGALWLGTQFEGALRVSLAFRKAGLTPAALDPAPLTAQITRYGKKHGLPETRTGPARVGDRIVFATQKGLRRFDAEREWFVPDSTLGAAFADTACWIFRIREDERGNAWVIAGVGKQPINGRAEPQADGSYLWQETPFLRLNDLGDMFIIYPECRPGGGSTVWFGGSEGIARYTSEIPKDYALDFETLLRRVLVNRQGARGDSVIFGGTPLSTPPGRPGEEQFPSLKGGQGGMLPTLPYTHNSLRFEFAAPSYDDVFANQYRLTLEGFDEDWSNWTPETRKDYTGLPEGDYVFKVQAKNIYGHPGSEARFEFTILPPWYRRWWAYGLYLLIFGTASYGFVHFQVGRVRRREQEIARLKEAEIVREKNEELRGKNSQLEKLLKELKEAQVGLRRSESRFRSVARTANDAIITANGEGKITFWNKSAEKIFGYNEGEALGQPMTLLMPERYKEAHLGGMEHLLKTGESRLAGKIMEREALRKDGTEFPIELTVAYWETDEGRFVTGIARDITLRKQALRELEEAHSLLETENQRKSGELEKARQLQLSMLPGIIPRLSGIQIEAYMKTAAEVGGDYYDIHLGEDDALTVVTGDATGHGLNAGMMVAAAKSLFATLADEPDILKLLQQMNRAFKRVNLRGLYMALQVLRIKDSQLEACSAGMPPLLIYRAATKSVEEIALKALPLGCVPELPAQKRKAKLAPGDTVLMMSDGFPERFNDQGEVFDYHRAQAAFEKIAHLPPEKIIAGLAQAGETWAGGQPRNDDETFVVLKIR